MVGLEGIIRNAHGLQSLEERVDGAVAYAADGMALPLEIQIAFKMHLGILPHMVFLIQLVTLEGIRLAHIQIFLLEQIEYFLRLKFPSGGVAGGLDYRPKFRMHSLGHIVAEILLHNRYTYRPLPDWLLIRIIGS